MTCSSHIIQQCGIACDIFSAVIQVPGCDGVSRVDPGGGTVSRSADHHRHQLQTSTVCVSKIPTFIGYSKS